MKPLTADAIEMTRQGLLNSEWCGFSKRDTVNQLCDLAMTGLLSARSESKESSEMIRLKEIEHQAWHLLDDSEHRQDNGEVVVLKSNFDALSALLPEGHP